jgi:hypothetical protein
MSEERFNESKEEEGCNPLWVLQWRISNMKS